MIYRTSDEKIAEYEQDGSLNQSGIKVILKSGIQEFQNSLTSITRSENYYSEKESQLVGKAVDCIITSGSDSFAKKYHGSDTEKPGDKVLSIVKWVFDNTEYNRLPEIKHYIELVKVAINLHNYYSNWGIEARFNSVCKEGQEYWESLVSSEGKQVLSVDEWSLSQVLANNILTHPHTAALFKDGEGIDIVHQFPMYFQYLDIPCKGLPDTLRINHKLGIINTIDIKTTMEHILMFNEVIRRFRYDIQGSFYIEGLFSNLVRLSNLIGRDVTKYSIRNFAFVAESKSKPGTPLKFPLSEEVLSIGQSGDGRIKGFHQGVQIYKAWLDKGFCIEDMFKDTNGTVYIEKDFNYNYPSTLIF